MASFSQWRKSLDKHPEPRQITWVCGSERVLVDDVVESVVERLGPEPWNYVPLSAGDDSERAIWAEASQHPMGDSPRVVVVRNSELLEDWDRFQDWIKYRALNPRTYLILVSNEERIQRAELTQDQKRRGERAEVAPHLAAIGTKGHIIECRPYTTATARYSIDWVQSKVRMRDGIAQHLLTRANFDLRRVRDVCRKLAVFPNEITISVINALLAESPRDSFSDALFSLDKKTALLALDEVPLDDYGRTLGLLDSRLDLAGLVHDMQVEHHSPSEITRAAGSQSFLVKDLIPVSRYYDSKRRLAIRKVLAIADEAYHQGHTSGVMEAVVAFW